MKNFGGKRNGTSQHTAFYTEGITGTCVERLEAFASSQHTAFYTEGVTA
jgi:hypothetical protein